MEITSTHMLFLLGVAHSQKHKLSSESFFLLLSLISPHPAVSVIAITATLSSWRIIILLSPPQSRDPRDRVLRLPTARWLPQEPSRAPRLLALHLPLLLVAAALLLLLASITLLAIPIVILYLHLNFNLREHVSSLPRFLFRVLRAPYLASICTPTDSQPSVEVILSSTSLVCRVRTRGVDTVVAPHT